MNTVLPFTFASILIRLCLAGPALDSISGVTQGLNESPIANVDIALLSSSMSFHTRSNQSGEFNIVGIPAGNYELQAMGRGTKRVVQHLQVGELALQGVTITLMFGMCDQNPLQGLPTYHPLSGSRGAEVAGTIKGSRGRSISGVDIALLNPLTREQTVPRTSRNGAFVISGIAPGRYTITAAAKGYSPAVIPDIWAVTANSASVLIQMNVPGGACQ